MSSSVTPALLGLQAWEVQRRNAVRRWRSRAILAALVVSAFAWIAPARYNPVAAWISPRGDTEHGRQVQDLQTIQAAITARQGRSEAASAAPALSDHLPAPLAAAPHSATDLACLTRAVYFEARGESLEGQIAVAQVVINRVAAHPGSTLCSIVNQGVSRGEKCQFSFACFRLALPSETHPLWLQAHWIANEVAAGRAFLRELNASQHYHSVQVKPTWRHGLSPIRRIGQHIFYNPLGKSADLSMVAQVVQRWDEPGQYELLLDDGTTVRQAEMTTTAAASTVVGPKPVVTKRPIATEKATAQPEAFNPFTDGSNSR